MTTAREHRIADLKERIRSLEQLLKRDSAFAVEICQGIPSVDPEWAGLEEEDALRYFKNAVEDAWRIRELRAELAALEA